MTSGSGGSSDTRELYLAMQKILHVQIQEVQNGYIVWDGSSLYAFRLPSQPDCYFQFPVNCFVAKNQEELGELIVKLADKAKKAQNEKAT